MNFDNSQAFSCSMEETLKTVPNRICAGDMANNWPFQQMLFQNDAWYFVVDEACYHDSGGSNRIGVATDQRLPCRWRIAFC